MHKKMTNTNANKQFFSKHVHNQCNSIQKLLLKL